MLTLKIGTEVIRLQSDLTVATDIFSRQFRHYLSEQHHTPTLTLGVHRLGSKPAPSLQRHISWIRECDLWGELTDTTLRLTDGFSWMEVSYENRTAQLWISEHTLKFPLFFARTFLTLPLLELLRCRGYYYLHGAYVSRKQHRVLLLGRGKVGKSTLTAALIQSGWTFMGDDSLLISRDLESDHCVLMPFEQEMALSPESAASFKLSCSWTSEHSKVRLPSFLMPGWSPQPSAPNHIMLLDRDRHFHQQRLSASDLFHRLIQDNPFLMTLSSLAQQHFDALKCLIQQASSRAVFMPTLSPLDLHQLASYFEQALMNQDIDAAPGLKDQPSLRV